MIANAAQIRGELEARKRKTTAARSLFIDEALGAGRGVLRQACCEAWKPREKKLVSDWAESTLKLDPSREATAAYDLTRRPWWRAVLDTFADSEVRNVYMPAATQIGKTLALIASILWCADNAPAPGMVVLPDQDSAIEFRDRVYADAAETIRRDPNSRLKVPPERKWNTRFIDLGTMRVYLAWSGSRQKLRGRPCRYVWLSEIDVYKGDKRAGNPIEAAHQRTKAFFRGMHYHESSPVEYPSDICALESQATARYRWHCECPTCGKWQELRFFVHTKGEKLGKGGIGGFKNEAGELVSAETARKHAHYICEEGCILGNELKSQLLESGAWVPLGSKVLGRDAKGNVKFDGPVPTSRRDVGFHLWSIHSESVTFGDLAAAYLHAKEKGTVPEFWGNWLGMEWKQETKLPSWSQLGKRMAWTHERGTVPRDAWFLTAGCDVQGENNGVRVNIRAWAPGRTSWLVDWFWIDRVAGDENDLVKGDLKRMENLVLRCRFPIAGGGVNPFGKSELAVRLLLIDTNYLPMKVHHWMRSLPESWTKGDQPRVRAIRGDHQLKAETRWRKNIVKTSSRTGEVYEGDLEQWGIYVYPFYDELTQALQSEPGKPGAWYVSADTLRFGKSYLEQVTNFAMRVQIDPKTGKKKRIWDAVNHRIPIDFWDTEIYNLVAANMIVNDVGWDPEAMEALRPKPVSDRPKNKNLRPDYTPTRIGDSGDLDFGAR